MGLSSVRLRASAVILAAAVLLGPSPHAQSGTLRPLGGIDPVKSCFNANAAHARVIFLLSPT